MNVVIFLLLLFLIWLLFRQQIKRWFAGFMARRTEDYIRKATGMPPRPGSREARRQQREEEKKRSRRAEENPSYYSQSSSSRRNGRRYYHDPSEPIIPKEYAEDVEFVETISYSRTTIGLADTDSRYTVYHESQVSDVEWEEVKLKRK